MNISTFLYLYIHLSIPILCCPAPPASSPGTYSRLAYKPTPSGAPAPELFRDVVLGVVFGFSQRPPGTTIPASRGLCQEAPASSNRGCPRGFCQGLPVGALPRPSLFVSAQP